MSDNARDFKGVWIPRAVWLDDRLNALDKIILIEIDSLDSTERGCFASNKYIADFCQCSESKVSHSISKLTKLGYIFTKSFDGRQRELKSCLSFFTNQPCKICEADLQKMNAINKENNIGNNIVISPTSTGEESDPLEEYPPEYYQLQAAPRKFGKGVVMLSEYQFDLLCEKLSLDEINIYISKLADFIIEFTEEHGYPPTIKSHYAKILEWVEEDRKG